MTNNKVDTKRILIFLAFAFGIAWLVALVIFLTGGLANSPEIIPNSGFTLALVLMAVGYMGAPALANVFTRLVTREGWKNLNLRPRKYGWPYWIIAWFIPAVMTILGGGFFFALLPQYFDPSLSTLRDMLAQSGQPLPMSPWLIVALQTLQGVLIAPIVNGLFTFGEEFGWRAYLQPKLLPLGSRKAILLLGVIWGVWHWPAIAMGHNYGLEYAGAPWLGMLMMVLVTIGLGTFLGWVTIKGGCAWPAVIGHAAINGISALPAIFVKGTPNPLLGPLPVGILGMEAWIVLTLVLLLVPRALEPRQQPLPVQEPDPGVPAGIPPAI